jgi:type VI secretion system protein ImpH
VSGALDPHTMLEADLPEQAPVVAADHPADETAGHREDTGPALPPDQRRALLERLTQEPERFSFYAAMRLLEAAFVDHPRFGLSNHPEQDPLRLAQEPTVTHPSSALAALELADDDVSRNRLLVHFFGLFGTDGPLPLHLTEYARERRRNYNDPSFQRFADVFHHRALSLFYRAWADVRPTVAFDRPNQDRWASYVGSLIGYGLDSFRNRDAMPDLTKLHFAGLFANQTRNAEGLSQILSAFFAVPVRLEQFHGAWIGFPEEDRTHLSDGAATAQLGRTAVLGSRVWTRQHKFRIVFGPLSLQDYRRLLPGGLSFHRLVPIVRNYIGDVMMWDVNLVLKATEVPKIILGQQGQLGWTTWLNRRSRGRNDAASLFLDASADSHASQVDHATTHHQ